MAIWASQSLQFVWFPTSVDDLRADAIYQAIIGSEPDTVQRNKVPSPINPFISVAHGTYHGIEATVQIQPGRVDLMIEPEGRPLNSDVPTVPLMDTRAGIDRVIKSLSNGQIKWPAMVRQSIVANLISPAATEAQANERFFHLVGMDLGLDDVAEPIFQVNRRKQLPSVGILINRVVRFSVTKIQEVLVQVAPTAAVQHFPMGRMLVGVGLQLDINTIPEGPRIEPERQVAIFDALASELYRLGENATPKALAG